MERVSRFGVQMNRVSLADLLLNKTVLIATALLILAGIGIYELFHLRYFSAALTAHDAGLDPTNPALKEAMRQAVFGTVGEIDRNLPWTILISNYMYMIYTGSGIIFLVALAELMKVRVVAKAAAGFMMVGLAMLFGGFFTIATDLNLLNMHYYFLTPNFKAAMWMMFPLYSFYVPLVIFEIYLLLTENRQWAMRLALPIVLLSIAGDIIEYYIQAKLFAMNTARQLWTEFPLLPLYFILSALVAALGIMGLYSFLVHRKKSEYPELMENIRKGLLFFIPVLAVYELIAYLVIDKAWAALVLTGPFGPLYFGGFVLLTLAIPFLLALRPGRPTLVLIGSLSAIIGGFIGRFLFVYGGNAMPLSDRSGTGFERYEYYGVAKSFIFNFPHLGELFIVIGSIGVAMIIYSFSNSLFSVGELREHH